jgi:hypothetical protein
MIPLRNIEPITLPVASLNSEIIIDFLKEKMTQVEKNASSRKK